MTSFESKCKRPVWFLAFALTSLVVGCGGGGGDGAGPTAVDPVGAVCTAGAACVPLGTAGNYTILAMSGVTTTGTSAITGHVASASSASNTTGFSETLDASNTFATSAQVTGRMYASDYAAPTPAELTQATATDATAAFASADGKANSGAGFVDVGTAGNITGLTLVPGVYEWTTGVSVDAGGTVTLAGTATDVWVFKISGDITMNPGATVTLTGALPQNVFWRTSGVAALNTTANLKGIVLSGSSVTMASGATVNGRLIASSAVTLIANTVTRPAP